MFHELQKSGKMIVFQIIFQIRIKIYNWDPDLTPNFIFKNLRKKLKKIINIGAGRIFLF